MNLLELCNLQGSLFLMILAGEYRDSLQYCEIVPDFI